MDPLDFLAAHPPFDRLGDDDLSALGRALEVVFQPRGSFVLSRAGAASGHLFVVRKGAVRLERDGRVLQVLEEGEPFGYPSLLTNEPPHADVVAEEDSLLLRIPGTLFHRLMERPGFADHFALRLARRLGGGAGGEAPTLAGDLSTPVGRLLTRTAVVAAAGDTVATAAGRMGAEGVSSILVEGDPPGIVTDRDLRGRVLAAGRPASTPVGEVASRPLVSVDASATVFEALVLMVERRIHHLGVRGEGGIAGVVSDTDLLRHHLKSPLSLLARIEKSTSAGALAGFAGELAGMVEVLFAGGLGAVEIGRLVATVNDAAAARLLRLAEEEAGPAPAPYAWIVHGSEGRREQGLVTDQDNAIVHADGAPDAWFAALGRRVVAALGELGVPPCPGGFMADRWSLPRSRWTALFEGWLESPGPQALVDAANFFDFRPVYGGLHLAPLEEVLRRAPLHRTFLAHLARNAAGLRPPLGLFHRLRPEAAGVDLKRGGIAPLVALARVHSLEAGSTARGTLERLADAAGAGTLSAAGAEDLAAGFRFLLRLRLEHQLLARREGRPVDHRVRVDHLSPLERRHLKDTFRVLREVQDATAQRFATDLLG